MALSKEQAADKVRKLLALAGSAGTEGEALAALAQAQRIMCDYELSAEDAAAASEEMTRTVLFRAPGKYLPSFLTDLAWTCGQVNGVEIVWIGTMIEAYGQASKIALVSVMFSHMRDQVDKLADECKEAKGKAGKRAFRAGCVSRIRDRLRESRRQAEAEAAERIAALPPGPVREVRETALAVYRGLLSKAKEYAKQRCGKIRSASASGAPTRDANARSLGYQAGGRVAFTSAPALK